MSQFLKYITKKMQGGGDIGSLPGVLSLSGIQRKIKLDKEIKNQKALNSQATLSQYTPKPGDQQRMNRAKDAYRADLAKPLNRAAASPYTANAWNNLVKPMIEMEGVASGLSGVRSLMAKPRRIPTSYYSDPVITRGPISNPWDGKGIDMGMQGSLDVPEGMMPYIGRVEYVPTTPAEKVYASFFQGKPRPIPPPYKKSGFDPLALVDNVAPRIDPIKAMGVEMDIMDMSPLNLIPGYGRKLSGKNQTFRKFGNSLDDVIQRQALSPAGGSKFRMGKDQIASEGNWAARNQPSENYPGVFEATFDMNNPNANLSAVEVPNRNGVLMVDRSGRRLPEIPLTEPGMSFNRRLPFSTRYVPIDKQKLMNNQFQFATMAPRLQSLAEKYALGLGAASALGKGARDTYDKYTVDPVIDMAKKLELERLGLNFKKRKGGIITDPRGQWAHPGKVTRIPSNQITMQGVDYPVYGVSDTGDAQMMYPGGEYSFNGSSVTEYPMMESGGQHGGLDRWFAEKWVDVKTGKDCGRQEGESRKGYPACRPSRRVNEDTPKTAGELSSAEREKFKREKTSSERINYQHRRKQDGGETNETDMANKPNNPELWSRAKSLAKQKFDVYPSAYANGWAAKWYKGKGGSWSKAEYGMQVPYLAEGGTNNPGFQALPEYVQAKILSNMGYGGMTYPFMQDGGEPNGEMAMGQMASVSDKMSKLLKFVKPDENLDPWIASKLAVMDHSADAISDYMMYGPDAADQEEIMKKGGAYYDDSRDAYVYGDGSVGPNGPAYMKNGGYTVTRSNDRKGKTHKVTGPDGTVKYFGDSKLGQHPKDPERKKAFYARHKKNLESNPYFRAFARKTWQDGGEYEMMENGGTNNPGFKALPEYVQQQILSNMAVGGYIGQDGRRHMSNTPTWSGNAGYKMGGQPCYECGGMYAEGGYYDCPDQEKDPVTGKCAADVARGKEAAAANKAAGADMNAWAKQVAAMDKMNAKQDAAQYAGQMSFDYDWMGSPVEKAEKKAAMAQYKQFFQQNPKTFVPDDTSGFSPEQKYIIASKLKQKVTTPMGSKAFKQKFNQDPNFFDLGRLQSDIVPMMGGWNATRNYLFGNKKYGGININPANEGKFTAAAERAGMGVQEFANKVLQNKDDYSSTTVKRANFARNAAGWKKQEGGPVTGEVMDVTPEELEMLRAQGYQFEIL